MLVCLSGPVKIDKRSIEKSTIQENFNRPYTMTKSYTDQAEKAISIVYKRTLKEQEQYIFMVLPDKREIRRSLKDLYWLRDQLTVEFPFYYVI